MENGVNVEEENKSVKMGATGNTNAARLAALQERKKSIEESLAKCNEELTQLCIQEADLTGILPTEMPIDPGNSYPLRRRVGTTYSLPENLIKDTNIDEKKSIADLELECQLHAHLAEAALGLANEQNMSKTMKRQHTAAYQQHKREFTSLQKKIAALKENSITDQQFKQKKKPRSPEEQEDNISVTTNINESFSKTSLRHSSRSIKYSVPSEHLNRNSEPVFQESPRNEDAFTMGFYRLSINGYNNYIERQENINNNYHPSSPYSSGSPQGSSYGHIHNPHMHVMSQQLSPHHPHYPHNSHLQYSPRLAQRPPQQMYSYSPPYQIQDCNKYNTVNSHISPTHLQRQSTTSVINPNIQKPQYYPSHTIHGQPSYRQSQNIETIFRNPHQIQPHQQYEQHVMTSGLGGCWKKSETGEVIWCSNVIESNWQRDKRFGSLDRRKNKRVQKRVSPSIENKSATMGSSPSYPDHVTAACIKSPQVPIVNRRSQDNRQLVRTQSLGSVGAQTIDSVWPSDDNSSCESDNRSINDINQVVRKHKEKEWLETSLDGPVSPTHSLVSRSHSIASSVLAPEEKYVILDVPQSPPKQIPPPIMPKPPLEIPAESNPSPRIPETNLELYNNNIPKNCTVVQAGHCKPYHEETKPFEMSDFYKYSTKFKKSPNIQESETIKSSHNISCVSDQRSSSENFEESKPYTQSPSSSYQNYNHSNGSINSGNGENLSRYSTPLNTSFDLNQVTVANHFSAEMNAWFKSHEHQSDNNNSGGSPQKNRSTATLV